MMMTAIVAMITEEGTPMVDMVPEIGTVVQALTVDQAWTIGQVLIVVLVLTMTIEVAVINADQHSPDSQESFSNAII